MNLENYSLDHGSAVPLYFSMFGWTGKVVALGYSFLSDEDHVKFGECIRFAATPRIDQSLLSLVVILSHRLKPDAPAVSIPQPSLRRRSGERSSRNSAQRISAIDTTSDELQESVVIDRC